MRPSLGVSNAFPGNRRLWLPLVVCLVAAAILLPETPSDASAAGKNVTVRGVKCYVYAQNPHVTTRGGNKVVLAKGPYADCRRASDGVAKEPDTITWRGILERCVAYSWGCGWTEVASKQQTKYAASSGVDLTVLQYTEVYTTNCQNKKFRFRDKITVYNDGSSGSTAWDYSQTVNITNC
jgi:hypothetical protein